MTVTKLTIHEAYAVEIYKQDVVVRRVGRGNPNPAPRGSCKEWSDKSRKNLAFVASNTDVEFMYMITLTYPSEFPTDGHTCKRHLKGFLNWMRDRSKACNQPKPEYLWFFEFQKRGAPHFHVILDCDVEQITTKSKVSKKWYKIVGSGDERHLQAGTRVEVLRSSDGGKRYAVKYAMKMQQKSVPEGFRNSGRFWGNSKGVAPKPLGWAQVDGDEDLAQLIKGWEYEGALKNIPLSTLYNASETVINSLRKEGTIPEN